jgi:hypothetical protein
LLQTFITLKNPLPSVVLEPTDLEPNGKHANHYTTEDERKYVVDDDEGEDNTITSSRAISSVIV